MPENKISNAPGRDLYDTTRQSFIEIWEINLI